ncbi:hypothetical protein ACSVDM_08720 [Nocardia sp. JW2]|uniref:hypothetical protein n=1 Tax=Nocardia sp. JW2 TaxID=3450738 RepID=UPI003F43F9BD
MTGTHIARTLLPGLVVVAGTLLLGAPTAAAESVWSYTCTTVEPNFPDIVGTGCTPGEDAPAEGPIDGEFVVTRPDDGARWICSSGMVSGDVVEGAECDRRR